MNLIKNEWKEHKVSLLFSTFSNKIKSEAQVKYFLLGGLIKL